MPHGDHPLISISNNGGLQLIPDKMPFLKVSAVSLLDKHWNNETFFDAENVKWTYTLIADKFKPNWFTEILARTFYNPRFRADVLWVNNGLYTIAELKEKIKHCVDKYDDIITQFEEGDVIKIAIDKATTFEDIVAVLNKYVFEVDEEALWKEHDLLERKQNISYSFFFLFFPLPYIFLAFSSIFKNSAWA